MRQHYGHSRFNVEVLEQRILLSADGSLGSSTEPQDPLALGGESAEESPASIDPATGQTQAGFTYDPATQVEGLSLHESSNCASIGHPNRRNAEWMFRGSMPLEREWAKDGPGTLLNYSIEPLTIDGGDLPAKQHRQSPTLL